MPNNRLTLETEIQLLDFFRDNQCLWHSKHADYSNKKVRNAKLNDAARLIQVSSGKEAYEKFRNLRTTYYRELKRTQENEEHKSKWRHFVRMSFLRSTIHDLDGDESSLMIASGSGIADDSTVSEPRAGELEVSLVTNHNMNSVACPTSGIQTDPNQLGTNHTQIQPFFASVNGNTQFIYADGNKVPIASVDPSTVAVIQGQIVSQGLGNTRMLQSCPTVQRVMGSHSNQPVILSRQGTLTNGVPSAGQQLTLAKGTKSVQAGTPIGTSQLFVHNPSTYYSVVNEHGSPPPLPNGPIATTVVSLANVKKSCVTATGQISKTLQVHSATPTQVINAGASPAKRAKTTGAAGSTLAAGASTASNRPLALLHSTPPTPAGPSLVDHLESYVKKSDLIALVQSEFQKLITDDNDVQWAMNVASELNKLPPHARESLKLSIRKMMLESAIQNSSSQHSATPTLLVVSTPGPSSTPVLTYSGQQQQVQAQVSSNGLLPAVAAKTNNNSDRSMTPIVATVNGFNDSMADKSETSVPSHAKQIVKQECFPSSNGPENGNGNTSSNVVGVKLNAANTAMKSSAQ